jgi:hypothetical protein
MLSLLCLYNIKKTCAMNCMHLCLWKTLSQDCPHGEIWHSQSWGYVVHFSRIGQNWKNLLRLCHLYRFYTWNVAFDINKLSNEWSMRW